MCPNHSNFYTFIRNIWFFIGPVLTCSMTVLYVFESNIFFLVFLIFNSLFRVQITYHQPGFIFFINIYLSSKCSCIFLLVRICIPISFFIRYQLQVLILFKFVVSSAYILLILLAYSSRLFMNSLNSCLFLINTTKSSAKVRNLHFQVLFSSINL